MSSVPANTPAAASPLSPGHIAAISAARIRGKKIRRAALVAAISGWTMAVFAVITLMGGAFGDWIALGVGIPLAAVAVIELRGAAMIRRFMPTGATLLAFNQLGLCFVLIGYASFMLIYTLHHPVLAGAGADAQMLNDAGLGNIGDLERMLTIGLYGGLAVFGLVGPGLTAIYYQTRRRHIERMLDETPDWVIETLRAAG